MANRLMAKGNPDFITSSKPNMSQTLNPSQQPRDTTGEHEAVHLAVGWDRGAKEPWVILSDEPTGPETLREYGLRFNIEEGFLDQKSNGFQWESSCLRDRFALQRLCFVMAVATLALICQGSAVVAEGRRRVIDPHWYRGHSYIRIGWDWIQRALAWDSFNATSKIDLSVNQPVELSHRFR
ncbi:hypothetical protein CCP4SC76_7770002 [Gammaproteobacteria bacterium]